MSTLVRTTKDRDASGVPARWSLVSLSAGVVYFGDSLLPLFETAQALFDPVQALVDLVEALAHTVPEVVAAATASIFYPVAPPAARTFVSAATAASTASGPVPAPLEIVPAPASHGRFSLSTLSLP